MSSARTALQKPRSSMRSPTAAATPTLVAAEPCRRAGGAQACPYSCVPPSLRGRGKYLSGRDWSAIEARITPWLAASPGAEKVLDIFRANDRDPTRPDIYTLAAADILHKNDPSGVTKTERGIGKVATFWRSALAAPSARCRAWR